MALPLHGVACSSMTHFQVTAQRVAFLHTKKKRPTGCRTEEWELQHRLEKSRNNRTTWVLVVVASMNLRNAQACGNTPQTFNHLVNIQEIPSYGYFGGARNMVQKSVRNLLGTTSHGRLSKARAIYGVRRSQCIQQGPPGG